ncbi:TonB-dependent siderophore receptor [Paracoccus litorisediminis]|uniref:TonB-dependent siderophore receptor n=1 Tax=Paracoccus litorisediminis TaxID=2006130 RepID=A0A844HNU5_9RHOB|nr:TonB-dependent siderophore receptor [Paracoccus litorisediminis]MTH60084.1 TonB-dependent siderophore receptor [Paracoccus litorisediminis]
MLLSYRFALLAGTSLLALALPALAQDAPTAETVVLDEVVLDATAPTQGYVVPTTQIATKTNTPVLETQQSVSVITRQQIEDQGAQNMTQALRYTAGVTAEPFGADPRFDQPRMRGFDVSNSQYLNGLHLIRDFGAMSLDLYGLERVEVLRGPSSALYGSGSPGGIINMVQKHAQPEDFSEAGVSYGTHGNASVFFDMNRAPSDTLAWRLTGNLANEQEQVEELENQRGYLAGALRWELDDVSTLDVMLSYQKDKPLSPTGVPHALTDIGDADDLRELYAGYPDEDDSDRRMLNLGVEYKRELDNGWRLEQGFRYQKFDWDYTGFYVTGLTGDMIGVGSTYQDETSDTVQVDTRLIGEAVTGAATHRLLFGLDVSRWSGRNATDFGTAPSLNWRNPDYSVPAPRSTWYNLVNDISLEQIGVYAQDEISWNNWRASLALRHDWAQQSGTAWNNFGGETDVSQKDEATTGRVGLTYLFDNGVAPYVSYATSFEPEIGPDNKGDTLKPTEGKQWEAGVKYQPEVIDALVTLAVYDLKQTNVTRNMGGDIGNIQIGEVHSRGVELEGTAELAEGWDIRASYAYTDARQKGGAEDGRRMPDTPYNSASLWLDRDFGNGFRLGGGIRYVGERDGVGADWLPTKVDGFTVGDVAASYTRDNIVASINVFNITDEAYISSCSGFGCFYGDGREVLAKLTYKW